MRLQQQIPCATANALISFNAPWPICVSNGYIALNAADRAWPPVAEAIGTRREKMRRTPADYFQKILRIGV
jgi:hypothetical protein